MDDPSVKISMRVWPSEGWAPLVLAGAIELAVARFEVEKCCMWILLLCSREVAAQRVLGWHGVVELMEETDREAPKKGCNRCLS